LASVGIRLKSWYIRWYKRNTNAADTNMALSDLAIRAAKPGPRLVKLSDGGGLQLWVMPDGAKRWRLAYRFAGSQKALAIGVYPATSLREAREARDEAKRFMAEGRDPSLEKRLAKAAKASAAANTFDAIAAELLDKKRREAKADRTLSKLEWLLSLARPAIGARPIAEITAPEVLGALRAVESRGRHETAKRLRATIGQVFRYAVATGRAEADPTGALRGALAAPVVNHRAAITDPKALGGLLRAIASYEGAPETRAALELLALTFVRPGELRAAEWAEFDLDAAVWSIPSEKMKMKRPHRSARAARRRYLEGTPGNNRTRKIPFPIRPLILALHERKYDQRRASAHGFRQRRDDGPRLPRRRQFTLE
jgi:integrase